MASPTDEQALLGAPMPDSVSVPDQVPVDSIKAPALKVALPTVEANNTTKRKRNLIVCIDGTSNQFSKKSTNVIQLYSYIKKDDSQLTYYNSGIGTYAKPSWRSVSYMKQVFDNTIDLAIAWNLEKVIIGAYRWLSDTYQTGDRIFLFGFSRGAYQVRALAAMINKVGLLHAGNQEQIPFAWELYAKSEDEDAESLTIFKKAFSREDVKVHFIGAWDTVSSVGIIRGRLLPGVAECQDVKYFRHALALDERRVKFLPEHVDCEDGLLDMSEKADGHGRIKEVWFAGTHSDIGGGNKDNSHLSRGTEPLIWMVGEAKHAGLATTGFDPQVDIKGAEVTESLRGFWRVLEHLPVSRASYKPDGTNTLTRMPHMGHGRKVLHRHKIHFTVLANFQREIIDDPRRQYQPKAKLIGGNRDATGWNTMFDRAAFKSSPNRWEGDEAVIDALHVMKPFDKMVNEGDIDNLRSYTTDPGKANLLWTYGGLAFIQKLVVYHTQNEQVGEIILSIIGLKLESESELKPSKQAPAQSDTNEPNASTSKETSHSDHMKNVIPRVKTLLKLWDVPDKSMPISKSRTQVFKSGLWRKPKVTRGESNEPSDVSASTSDPNATSRQSMNSLASIAADAVLGLNSRNDDQVTEACLDSGIFDLLPCLLPDDIDSSLRLARRIVTVIADLANKDYARQGLIRGKIIPKLLSLLLRSDGSNLAPEVIRAIGAMAGSYDAAHQIVDQQGLPKILEFVKGNDLSLARGSVHAIAELAQWWEITETLKQAGAGQMIMNLLKLDKRTVVEDITGDIAIIARQDVSFFSSDCKNTAESLVKLVETTPNASKAVAILIDDDELRAVFIKVNLVERMKQALKKINMKVVQETIRSIVKLVKHEDSKEELAKHNIVMELFPVLVFKAPGLAQEALSAIEQLTRATQLITPEVAQRLMSLAKDDPNPIMKLAIVRAGILYKEYHETAQQLVPSLFDLMINENGELAANARDTAFACVVSEGSQDITIFSRSFEVLARLLKLATTVEPYRWGSIFSSFEMISLVERALDAVEKLCENFEHRNALIEIGIFETVIQLTDSPVSYRVDRRADALVDKLQEYEETRAVIEFYMPHRFMDSRESETRPEPEPESESEQAPAPVTVDGDAAQVDSDAESPVEPTEPLQT